MVCLICLAPLVTGALATHVGSNSADSSTEASSDEVPATSSNTVRYLVVAGLIAATILLIVYQKRLKRKCKMCR